MTCILMLIFIALYVVIVLAGAKYLPGKEYFFDFYDSQMLKGLSCIIVVLVHIPSGYQNRIQDMIGSFAYIGVTFFFMSSAYGLKYGIKNKKNYLKHFWRRRLPALLIPALMCNIVNVIFLIATEQKVQLVAFLNIDAWVRVLLLFYLFFWLMHYLSYKLGVPGGYWSDGCICLFVLMYSVINYFIPCMGWAPESLGFMYGILLAVFYERIKLWTEKHWMFKCAVMIILGGIVGISYLKFKSVEFYGSYCLKVLLGAILILLILQIIRKVTIGNKVLAFLGSISYDVYLLHRIVFEITAYILSGTNSGLFIWTSVVLTVLLAVLVKMASGIIIRWIGENQCLKMFREKN